MIGCVTKTGTGALIGGAVGALAGQAIGGDTKSTLIGAGVGAAVGGAVGNQEDAKDKNKKQLQCLGIVTTIYTVL